MALIALAGVAFDTDDLGLLSLHDASRHLLEVKDEGYEIFSIVVYFSTVQSFKNFPSGLTENVNFLVPVKLS
jgi:hypothetical protein